MENSDGAQTGQNMDFLKSDHLPTELRTAITYENLTAGQTLFFQGDVTWAIFSVESGQISLVRYTETGQAIKHYGIKAGENFAHAALFNGSYDCAAIADVSSRIAVVPRQPLLDALQQYSDLAANYMAQLAQQLHEVRTLLDLRSTHSARERVLYYLHLSAQSDSKTVLFDPPLKEIAAELDLSPEAFSRSLSQLQRQGVLTRIKRRITLND